MNPFFSEMMKGFDPWKAWDATKAMEMFTSSDASRMGTRFIDFQKSAFNTTFDTWIKLQEQTEKVAAIFTSGNQMMPEAGQAWMSEWQGWFKENQVKKKKTVADNFDRLKNLMNTAS